MPQWDFLNFIAEQGRRYPSFQLKTRAEVKGLIEEDGVVRGVRAETPDGPLEVRAEVVIGADGRHSIVRELAGLTVQNLGAPMDVFWFRLSRHSSDPDQTFGRFNQGKGLIMLNRQDYWQCGYVIPKGSSEEIRAAGLPAFRADLAGLASFLGDRVEELRDWNDVKLLTVLVDRLKQWCRPGLLCIGDAAHVMSPVGGVGINLAIQDAVAAANLLTVPLREGHVSLDDLKKVQRRRTFPTVATQRLQIFIQNRVITRALTPSKRTSIPWIVRCIRLWPFLTRIPARLLGIGFRPEHIKTPDVRSAS